MALVRPPAGSDDEADSDFDDKLPRCTRVSHCTVIMDVDRVAINKFFDINLTVK
jgi:hypothetical protein